MAQGLLSFQYEFEPKSTGMTALGGLPLYVDLAHAIGLPESIRQNIRVRKNSDQGWTDPQMVMGGILLNEAGGEHVEDLNVLEKDDGFCRLLMRVEDAGMTRRQRRALLRRWRKTERKRGVPSPSAMFRYLEKFHDPHQEELRKKSNKKAFIPAPNEYLQGFAKVSADMAAWAQEKQPESTATLDLDATLIETTKAKAMYSYKKFKSYQPLNVWWVEHLLMLHTEFRDGNVPAGFDILRVFIESLALLPDGVRKVRVRSDTAAYQHDFIKYMATGKNERFGVIDFVIGCDVTDAFKEAVSQVEASEWKPITRFKNGKFEETGQEYAEVCYVPKERRSSSSTGNVAVRARKRTLCSKATCPAESCRREISERMPPGGGWLYWR